MKIKINKVEGPKYDLQIRETLDGRLFIMDHPDIDIVVIPEKSKIITFPKDEMREEVYGSQDIFFEYLVKRGLILPESVQGGSVYFSIEGLIPESKNNINPLDLTLANIAEFLSQEKSYFKAEEDYKKIMDKRLYSPEEDESTALGDVSHSEYKGAIPRGGRPFNFGNSMGVTYE